jgi:hypothetical protein
MKTSLSLQGAAIMTLAGGAIFGLSARLPQEALQRVEACLQDGRRSGRRNALAPRSTGLDGASHPALHDIDEPADFEWLPPG